MITYEKLVKIDGKTVLYIKPENIGERFFRTPIILLICVRNNLKSRTVPINPTKP